MQRLRLFHERGKNRSVHELGVTYTRTQIGSFSLLPYYSHFSLLDPVFDFNLDFY